MGFVLLLAHGNRIPRERCCPPSATHLLHLPDYKYYTVDRDPKEEPDVLHDLSKAPFPWGDETFDYIVDLGGHAGDHIYYMSNDFWEEIHRVLKPSGTFYGRAPRYGLRVGDYHIADSIRVESRHPFICRRR